jgi:SAM-dependent methyltransferase
MPDLCSQALEAVAAEIERQIRISGMRGGRLLDVGCWDGARTIRYAAAAQARPTGIEIFPEMVTSSRSLGIDVAAIDLERDTFPWEDGSFDVVVCNQVLEHLKNIWLAVAQIRRVLRPGGLLVVSVPNLSSLHNRILLCLGRQPTSIRVNGPHIRGFTFHEFGSFLSAGFGVERMITTGFHPFPARFTKGLCRLCPSLGHSVIAVCRNVKMANSCWQVSSEKMVELQTHY